MAIEEGDKIPALTLDGTEGEAIALADKLGHPFVLYFYPKDDTSGCTREAQDFSALLPSLPRSAPKCWASPRTRRSSTRSSSTNTT
jgi:peroxiredoxin